MSVKRAPQFAAGLTALMALVLTAACGSDGNRNPGGAAAGSTGSTGSSGQATAGAGATAGGGSGGGSGAVTGSGSSGSNGSSGSSGAAAGGAVSGGGAMASAGASGKSTGGTGIDAGSDAGDAQAKGPCCTAHAGNGCNDPAVEQCVCSMAGGKFCCTDGWNDACVALVGGLGCGVCKGSCCKANPGPGCADGKVETCVCNKSAECCNAAWDDFCVVLVESSAGGPACGSCQ